MRIFSTTIMLAGRNIMAPNRAAVSVTAHSLPNSRKEGRSENTETERPNTQHDCGQEQYRADDLDGAAHGAGFFILAHFLKPESVQHMDGVINGQSKGHRQRNDAGKLQAVAAKNKAWHRRQILVAD